MQKNLQFEQGMLEEREKRVRQIEEDVLDVNQIMRELNTLINQQGEAIGMSSFSFSSHSFGIAKCDAFFVFHSQIQLKAVLIMWQAMWKRAERNC